MSDAPTPDQLAATAEVDDFPDDPPVAAPTPWDPKFPDHVIEALIIEHCGNLSIIARELGVRRRYLAERCSIRPLLRGALADIREEVCDLAEDNVFARVKTGGNPADDRFVLSSLRKDIYSTRVEATGKGGAPFSVTIEGNDANL